MGPASACQLPFYMAFIPVYILILAFIILVDYVAALLIEGSAGWTRRGFLLTSIVANIGVLAVFKYYGFLTTNLGAFTATLHWPLSFHALSLVLPIGLSFHTFQAMSYTVEVYRGNYAAERHLGIYALYVMFFPQLAAGPIERPQNLLPQLRHRHDLDPLNVTDGLKLMAWGFFKKLAIADRLAIVVNDVYAHPRDYQGPTLLVATVFFTFQIYCDFSGYSDIAIGSAQVMGIRLRTNFRRPYLSTSVAEFWTRWHVSLSTWFRDYVYIPLGGNRVAGLRWSVNLLTTFLISGLWHGAGWTFIAWGALNGLYVLIGHRTRPLRDKLTTALGLDPTSRGLRLTRTITTFGLICIAFVLFRAATFQDAFFIGRQLPNITREGLHELIGDGYGMPAAYGICAICLLVAIESAQRSDDPRECLRLAPTWVRWSVYYALLAATITFGAFNRSPFIYFQF